MAARTAAAGRSGAAGRVVASRSLAEPRFFTESFPRPTWYVKLDEASGTRFDSGPFGHHFNEVGGTVESFAGKVGGAALVQEAVGNYLSLEDSEGSRMGRIGTLCGWVNLMTKIDGMAIVSKYLPSDFNFDFILTYQFNDDPFVYSEFDWIKNEILPDRIRVHCNAQTEPETLDYRTVLYANRFGSPPAEQWMFVAFRYRPGVMQLSVNNTGWDTLFVEPNSAGMNGVSLWRLGGHVDGVAIMDGALDEWAFFHYFLTDEHIAYLYNNGAGRTMPL